MCGRDKRERGRLIKKENIFKNTDEIKINIKYLITIKMNKNS